MNKVFVLLLLFGFSMASQAQDKPVKGVKTPKNIILLIGDGMGTAQVSSAYFYGSGEPNFSRFPVTGLIKTSSASNKITDSAAGATAFSAGKKTKNGYVGMDVDGKAVENLVEYFSKKGKSTGVIATSSITHATPACFYAHHTSRNAEVNIASQMLGSSIDFFAGGGQQYFMHERNENLIADLKANGFMIHLDKLDNSETLNYSKKHGYLLADKGMPRAKKRGDFLIEATELGLEYLSKNDSGFFMMIEGSQIDWAGHANFKNYLIEEVLDFDKTLGAVLDFAEKDGQTLVIVTADHETGGFSLSGKSKKFLGFETSRSYSKIDPSFSTRGHSATLVPVFSFGPGSWDFTGIYENTGIYDRIRKLCP
jgi:alkaline phosphatase